jgi:predicted AlkP superfamily phosphohydrolase/phosphomutase
MTSLFVERAKDYVPVKKEIKDDVPQMLRMTSQFAGLHHIIYSYPPSYPTYPRKEEKQNGLVIPKKDRHKAAYRQYRQRQITNEVGFASSAFGAKGSQ